MKSTRWILLLLGLFLCAAVFSAEPAKPPEPTKTAYTEYKQAIADFFKLVKQEKNGDAIDLILGTNPRMFSNITARYKLTDLLNTLHKQDGGFSDYSIVVDRPLGKSIMYVYIIAEYEDAPVRFEFMFFRKKQNWMIYNVDVSGDFSSELREIIVGNGFKLFQPRKAETKPGE